MHGLPLKLGSSNSSKLTAKLRLVVFQNAECKAFISVQCRNSAEKERYKRSGEICQNGITTLGKRTIRIASHCYQEMCEGANEFPGHTAFITLSYRQYIPNDHTAKRHLDNFLKRFRRVHGNDCHYIWVNEIQSSRLKNRGERAIHFHILTPHRIDKNWLNQAWNEVVMNDLYRSGYINASQRREWQKELRLHIDYLNAIEPYKSAKKAIPGNIQKPPKSTYLLLPNVTAVYEASNYMAKYISKEGHNIGGNMWNCSKATRELRRPAIEVNKAMTEHEANKIISMLESWVRWKRSKYYMNTDYHFNRVLWLPYLGFDVLEFYYSLMEHRQNEKREKNKVRVYSQ